MFKPKDKFPLHHALKLIDAALEIAQAYHLDIHYTPTPEELALFEQLPAAIWQRWTQAAHIATAMRRRRESSCSGAHSARRASILR